MNLSLSSMSLERAWSVCKAIWFDGWREIASWPLVRRIRPKLIVTLYCADGSEAQFLAPPLEPFAGQVRRVSSVAVELPHEMVLVRTIMLPASLAAPLVASVVAEEVRKSTPFGEAATDWGMVSSFSTDGTRLKVTFGLASKEAVSAYLSSKATVLEGWVPEVWVRSDDGIITINGHGEQARARRLRWLHGVVVVLCMLIVVECVMIWLSPFLRIRTRLFDANIKYAVLDAKAGPQLAVREKFQKLGAQLDEAKRVLRDGRPDITVLMDELTRIIPDDSFVSELRFKLGGQKILVTGETENASRLLQQISTSKLFSEVKSTGVTARVRDRETFTMEITVAAGEQQ